MTAYLRCIVGFFVVALAACGTEPVDPLATAASESSPARSSVDGRIDRQASASLNEPVATSSDSFAPIPGLRVVTLGKGPVSADFAASLLPGPTAEFRVRYENRSTLAPGSVQVGEGESTASFSFVGRGSNRVGCDSYVVEWRSPTGEEISLRKASLKVLFNFDRGKNHLACG